MKDLLSRSNLLATLVCVIVIALGYGLLSADEGKRAERMSGPLSLETQKVSVSGGVLESEAVEISAEAAPEPEAAPESAEGSEDLPGAMEEPVEDALPAEDYETLPEIPVDEEIPADAQTPEGTEQAEAEAEAEEFEPSECELVLDKAKSLVGTPYVMGGASEAGFDAPGFVQYVFSNAGVDLPRISSAMADAGELGTGAECDLAVYDGWVGISLGDGAVIGATNPRDGVIINDAGFLKQEPTYVDVLP